MGNALRDGKLKREPCSICLRSALPRIPADDREIWIKVLAALKTLEPAWGARARKIADWWSKTSSKYDPAGQAKAWESLNADRPDGVSVLTLFYLAREHGWSDSRRGMPPGGRQPLPEGVNREDFVAFMPAHSYIYMPTGQQWPAESVNARLPGLPTSIIKGSKNACPVPLARSEAAGNRGRRPWTGGALARACS